MRSLSRLLISAVLAAALAAPPLITGCAARVSTGYRVYDPYYGDYHSWDDTENGFYVRWENETHRSHKDFRHRSADDQKAYFTWRHKQH